MKNYSFKLEALLKLRRFKEQKAKIELGQINKEISSVEIRIEELSASISTLYSDFEQVLSHNTAGKKLHFFPVYQQGRKAHIQRLENRLFSLKNKRDEKLDELYFLMADRKLIKKLKDKDQIKFKKSIMKKLEEEIQDLNQITSQSRKKNEFT